jgi:exopolysaccharide production protein ExoQ
LRRFERVLIFLLFLLGSGVGEVFLAGGGYSATLETGPITQVSFALLYIAVFLFLLRKFAKPALALVLKEKWNLLICLWVLASTAWSVDPGESLRRSIALAGTTLGGLFIGMRFEPKQQLRAIVVVVGLGALATLGAVLLMPGVVHGADGTSFRGLNTDKNSLGHFMAIGVLCSALLAYGQRRHRNVLIAIFVVCCVLGVMSKSATALVVTVLIFMILPFRNFFYLRTRASIGVAAGVGMLVALLGGCVIVNEDQLLQSLGRDTTLTGRVPLWQFVIKEIAARPLSGFGFNAFWKSSEGAKVSEAADWGIAIPHAHNGFLEVWLGIGLIGLGILFAGMLRNLVLAIRVARTDREIDQAWPLILLVYTVLYNVTENSLLTVNSIVWMIYVANSFWLVRKAQEQRYSFQEEAELEPALPA